MDKLDGMDNLTNRCMEPFIELTLALQGSTKYPEINLSLFYMYEGTLSLSMAYKYLPFCQIVEFLMDVAFLFIIWG